MSYNFYGWESADVSPAYERAKDKINDPRDMYDILLKCWKADTCAPRMRDEWSDDNPTLGQCSITAFLVQDIFGGIVRGVKRPAGNYHLFNEVGAAVFDLTSEQFGDEILCYDDCPEQTREDHFSKQEKYERYLTLKGRFLRESGLGEDK